MFRYRPYWHIILIFTSILMLFLPQRLDRGLRSFFLGGITPFWKGFVRSSISDIKHSSPLALYDEIEALKSEKIALEEENYLLSRQIQEVQAYLQSEQHIESELDYYSELTESTEKGDARSFFDCKLKEVKKNLRLHLESIPAKVIYREPSSWSSFVWVNKGKKHNESLGKVVIQENSPVVLGDVVIGVVEYVGEFRSKIRLITDENLTLSVRATRGHSQNKALYDHLSKAVQQLRFKEDLFFSKEEQVNTLKILQDILANIQSGASDIYMAKGELHGSSKPLWRCRSQTLKGVGFNYNFSDEKGPAKNLGYEGVSQDSKKEALLKEGDLLVTTGMDGVFPKDLVVGIVSKIYPLEDNECSYQIEALSKAPHIDELDHVTILPSLDSF